VVTGCTDLYADNYNPDATDDDGSCLYDGCALGSSLGCSDQDIADGECGSDTWIGDGLCDGASEAWGVNFCCYDLDGGDCTEAECGLEWDASITGLSAEGVNYDYYGYIESAIAWDWDDLGDGTSCDEQGLVECWDGSCAEDEYFCPEAPACEFDWSNYGSANCDTAWDEYGLSCAALEADFGWDCAGCDCPGDAEAVCGDGACGLGEDHENCPEDCDAPLEIPEEWTCPESYYTDSWCDCGCGANDPTCDDADASLWQNCDTGSSCAAGDLDCTEASEEG